MFLVYIKYSDLSFSSMILEWWEICALNFSLLFVLSVDHVKDSIITYIKKYNIVLYTICWHNIEHSFAS